MTAEEVIAPGSPYYAVFAEYAKLGLDPAMLAELPPEMAIRIESMIGEEMGWGDAGLAVSLVVAAFPHADGRASSGNQELVDLCTGKIGCWMITHPDKGSDVTMVDISARVARRPAGQQGQHVGPHPGRRDRHQRPVLGVGVQRCRRAGRARLHQRRLRRRLLRPRRPSARHVRDHSARPARRVEGQAARQDRPARAAAGRDLLRQRARPEALRRRAARTSTTAT